jgi:regulator of protease activity HflC (stomatin/prohibitin superfamily)
MLIDEAYASKITLTHAVEDRLSLLMSEYGYEIIAVLITDVEPDKRVKIAMNEINGKTYTQF